MVCIPCIIIPAFLWFYYRFLRPYMGPVFNKLEEWLGPIRDKMIKWCPKCVAGQCPISWKKPTDGVIRTKEKGVPSATVVEDSIPEDDGLNIDSEEKLTNAVRSGTFGADVSGLRQRNAPIIADVKL